MLLFGVNTRRALFPDCAPAAPGRTNVPAALAVTAKPRVHVGSLPPIDKLPPLLVAKTPLVAVQLVPSTRMLIEPFNADVELPPLLEPKLDAVPPVPDGLAGLLEPHEATPARITTAATIRISCLITPPWVNAADDIAGRDCSRSLSATLIQTRNERGKS